MDIRRATLFARISPIEALMIMVVAAAGMVRRGVRIAGAMPAAMAVAAWACAAAKMRRES